MTLQQLHYVITITEMGSFNKASEVLYIAQPSLTGAVQELEKELGIVILTAPGKASRLPMTDWNLSIMPDSCISSMKSLWINTAKEEH